MTDSAQSSGWVQIENLKPRLRAHTTATAHTFRGSRWYILADSASGRHMRFNDQAYEFIGRLDGDRTVAEIYTEIQQKLGDLAPDRQDIIILLTQLYTAGTLHSSVAPDVEDLFKRYQAEQKLNRVKRWINPLALRFPLFDPDRFLDRNITRIRPLFSAPAALLWLLVVLAGLTTVFLSFDDLGRAVSERIITPGNLLIMLLVFPLMKLLHEFAHAFAVKIWGGEVHEMGITFLVLMPVPYVDASAAWGFQEKYKRVLVGAAGVIVELFLAAIAIIIWATVEPGLIKDTALAAFFIGGLSSLFFNGNPLLRFDGYYILQDVLEIPNLYTRSAKYCIHLLQRHALGMQSAVSPATADGEERWFLTYGILSWLYRMAIMLVIAIFLASKLFVVGVLLAAWSFGLMIVLPLYRGLKYLLTNPDVLQNRNRAWSGAALVSVAIIILFTAIPFRLYSTSQGVVWVPQQAHIYASTDGFVKQLITEPGTEVGNDTLLLELDNPELKRRHQVLTARATELQARYHGQRYSDRVAAEQTNDQWQQTQTDLAALESELDGLSVTSGSAGQFVVDEKQSLTGSYIKKGQAIGYIVNPDDLIVRMVIPQHIIGLVRRETRDIEIRLAEQPQTIYSAQVQHHTPSGTTQLPSRALGAAGGGKIPVDGTDQSGTTATQPVFQYDLKLDDNINVAGIGTTAFIRINHGRESLAGRWIRNIRQLLLSRLSI